MSMWLSLRRASLDCNLRLRGCFRNTGYAYLPAETFGLYFEGLLWQFQKTILSKKGKHFLNIQ